MTPEQERDLGIERTKPGLVRRLLRGMRVFAFGPPPGPPPPPPPPPPSPSDFDPDRGG